MSLVIKGGTIATADRTYRADVLVEGETIKSIGDGLKREPFAADARALKKYEEFTAVQGVAR